MNGRKVVYIDVSRMTEQELCRVLNIPYTPWYRSTFFWSMALCLSLPSVLMIIEILQ
jgi:hypothetical protein